jgi:molecular chaperone GrpE (heat shock protein)
MTSGSIGYWQRLWAGLLGRDVGQVETVSPICETGAPDEQAAQWHARAASLEMELAERDRQIEHMRSEYAALQAARARAEAGAGQEQLERIFKKLVDPLANLAALTAMADAGREVEAVDLIQLFRNLEKELHRAGLEPIGKPGEAATFDVARHQRMSGGAVRDGVVVTVHIPGYRLGEKILMKAMVSTREGLPLEESGNE